MGDPRNQFLVDFLHTETEAAEGFRLRHCHTCQGTAKAGLDTDERQAVCDRYRCGLRDPGRWEAEQEWAAIMYAALCLSGRPDPEAIQAFNDYGFATGSVTAALALEDDGRLMIGFRMPTLRGELHYLLFNLAGALAGVVVHNARTTIGAEARAEVGRIHELLKAHESRARRRRAAELRDQGVSDNEIATILDCTRGAIRHWLGAREEWPQRREKWWQAQKG